MKKKFSKSLEKGNKYFQNKSVIESIVGYFVSKLSSLARTQFDPLRSFLMSSLLGLS